jgi:hypothetical protein
MLITILQGLGTAALNFRITRLTRNIGHSNDVFDALAILERDLGDGIILPTMRQDSIRGDFCKVLVEAYSKRMI